MTAQVTGGNPRSTGIYYDDTWNHNVFPAGTTTCTGPAPGGEAAYEEAIDKNSNALDAGQGLTGLPGSIQAVYAGAASAAFYGVPDSDPRHPDVTGIAQHGVVYTGGNAKIAEHGGDDPQDRNVPVLLVSPSVRHGASIAAPVETTQIAPTILALLGLSPGQLQSVQIEHTRVRPGVR